jgi:Protein phosphatase 2C
MPSPKEEQTRCWHVGGRSVRGASHVRSALPNQDAIDWSRHAESADGFLLAVADGHGSARCFRSDYGSRFAVEAAIFLLASQPDENTISSGLVRRWRDSVQAHLAEHPLTGAELAALERKLGKPARRSVEMDPVLAYGSTLLAASVSDTTGLYLQLGDGDILIVSEDGGVSRPWPDRQELLGDETTSLATRNAAETVQLLVTRAPQPLPELILLSTDGYANSFREDRGFLAVGPDLLQMIRAEGIEPIIGKLESWLREASEQGSGDDITLGMLWRGSPAAEPV